MTEPSNSQKPQEPPRLQRSPTLTLPSAAQHPLSSLWRRWAGRLPLLLMLLVLSLTVALALAESYFARAQQRAQFLREVTAHSAALRGRLHDFEQLLQATRALWSAAANEPLPQDFARFAARLNLSEGYSEVSTLGFAVWIPSHEQKVLETLLGAEEPQREYQVSPTHSSYERRAPVVGLFPRNAKNLRTLGLDLYMQPALQGAIDAARHNRRVQSSEALAWPPGVGHPQDSFLMFLPLWKTAPETPSQEPAYFLYMAIHAEPFLQRLSSSVQRPGLKVQVQLADQPLLAQSTGQPSIQAPFMDTETHDLAGQRWTLHYTAYPTDNNILNLIAALTVLVGLIAAGMVYRLTDYQLKSWEQTEEINRNLHLAQAHQQQARAEFEAIFQAIQDAAAFTDGGGKVRLINWAMADQFGLKSDELSGQPLSLLHMDRRLDHHLTFQALTTLYQRRDGSQFYGEAQRSQVLDAQGQVLGALEVIRDVSERVQAEQALRAQENRSRSVLDAIPHIIWVSRASGEVQYVNALHRRYIGDHIIRDCVEPGDRSRYDQMWSRAFETKIRATCIVRLRFAGGETETPPYSERWVEMRVTPLLQSDGSVAECVASVTDVHDRLMAERLAQRNEAQYKGVLESMPQIVWLTDPQGRHTYFNQRWTEYVGAARAQSGFLAAMHPHERVEYQALWTTAIRSSQPFEFEHRLLGSNGRYRTFVTRGLPVYDEHGHILEWVGTSTDMDDSVYAKSAARLLSEVSETLTARVNDPLAVRTSQYQGVLNLITERFVDSALIWKAPELEVLASAHIPETWLESSLRSSIDRALSRVIGEQRSVHITDHPQLRVSALSGFIFHPLIGRDGTVLGVLGLLHRQPLLERHQDLILEIAKRLSNALDNDALRAKAQETGQALQQINQSLEERVQRRTLELQETNRELEAFSYSVSHDLRTPLRHILGFANLLKKEAGQQLGGKSERYLEVIMDAANRMSGLIDSLLEFSRMGRAPLHVVPVDLHKLVDHVWRNLVQFEIKELDDQAPRHEVHLRLDPLGTIPGDPNLLELVFQNLLSNALKYSKNRERTKIKVWSEERDGLLIIGVQDNGVGFDPQYADKLFGVFQRLHRADEFDGIGIGLANVRRIVTRHGGTVWAESQLGQGATFYISLPLQGVEG